MSEQELLRTALVLPPRARSRAVSTAQSRQKTAPAGMLCQKAKGARNSPAAAAQMQSTARPLGGMTSAVRRSSRSVICR